MSSSDSDSAPLDAFTAAVKESLGDHLRDLLVDQGGMYYAETRDVEALEKIQKDIPEPQDIIAGPKRSYRNKYKNVATPTATFSWEGSSDVFDVTKLPAELIARQKQRVVVIKGDGGSGKTGLASWLAKTQPPNNAQSTSDRCFVTVNVADFLTKLQANSGQSISRLQLIAMSMCTRESVQEHRTLERDKVLRTRVECLWASRLPITWVLDGLDHVASMCENDSHQLTPLGTLIDSLLASDHTISKARPNDMIVVTTRGEIIPFAKQLAKAPVLQLRGVVDEGTQLINDVKEFYNRNDDFCPPPLDVGDGCPLEYSLSMLLHTHRLTYLSRTAEKEGVEQLREADMSGIPDLLTDTNSTFAFVEAAAGSGKSTMSRWMALTQAGGTRLTLLVSLPNLVGVKALPYETNGSSGKFERHIMEHLISVALATADDLRDKVIARVFAKKDAIAITLVLDGYDEVSGASSQAVRDTLKLIGSKHTKLPCSAVFIMTSRPIHDNSEHLRKAVKFALQPWVDDDGKEYGKNLLADVAENVSHFDKEAKTEAFLGLLGKLDTESRRIPLLVDMVARHVLSSDNNDASTRYAVLESFVSRHLRHFFKRSEHSPVVARFRNSFSKRDRAVASVEEVLQRCALCTLNGERFNLEKLEDISDDCVESVKHCGLLRTVGEQPAFLYKMLSEYFVASMWVADFNEPEWKLPDTALDIKFEGVVTLFASGVDPMHADKIIDALAKRLSWGEVSHVDGSTGKLAMQLMCVISVAVYLDRLAYLVSKCIDATKEVNRRPLHIRPTTLQRHFLPGLAAARSASPTAIRETLNVIVVERNRSRPDVIAAQCLAEAVRNDNVDFINAIRELFKVEVTPSTAVPLGSVEVLETAIAETKKRFSTESFALELQAAATLAVRRKQKGELLQLLFDAFSELGFTPERPFVIDVATSALFPLSSTHPCNAALRVEERFSIHLKLPKSRLVHGDDRMDLRGCRRIKVLRTPHPTHDNFRFARVKHIHLPTDITGWTWMINQLVHLETVDVTAPGGIAEIGDSFLAQCTALKTLDLKNLEGVTTIGDSFLAKCGALKELTLPSLCGAEIGNKFLCGCSSLVKVDLAQLTNITRIEDRFLAGCSSLTSLDLMPLQDVTEIGERFLHGCSSLESLNLSPFHRVKKVGIGFLSGCSSLKSLDLTPFNGGRFGDGTTIEGSFLSGCSALTALDLKPLSKTFQATKTIPRSFLEDCSSLEQLDLGCLEGVTEIEHEFLKGCEGLKTIDLTPLAHVKKIGHQFLSKCSSLETVDLAQLNGAEQLQEVGHSFLYRCSKLKALNLAPLSGVKHVVRDREMIDLFLSECSSLETLDLSPLAGITEIGDSFLSGCTSLTELNLSRLLGLRSIGLSFVHGCTSLTKLHLPPLQDVTQVGDRFLAGCSSLTDLDLATLQNVSHIGTGFLEDCPSVTLSSGSFSSRVKLACPTALVKTAERRMSKKPETKKSFCPVS